MLVHAGDEQHVAPVEPAEAREGVGRDALVGMADMGRAIGVGNGGGDIKRGAFGHETGTLGSGFSALRGNLMKARGEGKIFSGTSAKPFDAHCRRLQLAQGGPV